MVQFETVLQYVLCNNVYAIFARQSMCASNLKSLIVKEQKIGIRDVK